MHESALFSVPCVYKTNGGERVRMRCGAANRIRTCDPVITNDVLYQLSYCGGPSGAFGKGRKRLHLISGSARLGKKNASAAASRITRPIGTENHASRLPDPARGWFVPRTHRLTPRHRCRDRQAPGRWESPAECSTGWSWRCPGAHGTRGAAALAEIQVAALAAKALGAKVRFAAARGPAPE